MRDPPGPAPRPASGGSHGSCSGSGEIFEHAVNRLEGDGHLQRFVDPLENGPVLIEHLDADRSGVLSIPRHLV